MKFAFLFEAACLFICSITFFAVMADVGHCTNVGQTVTTIWKYPHESSTKKSRRLTRTFMSVDTTERHVQSLQTCTFTNSKWGCIKLRVNKKTNSFQIWPYSYGLLLKTILYIIVKYCNCCNLMCFVLQDSQKNACKTLERLTYRAGVKTWCDPRQVTQRYLFWTHGGAS